ncbi:MAG: hypothetical protein EA383_01505 [Spirochaetaceae bacterium]|nr:MAG: hypothetical protein EA383_01505 [Spirochaetaceae bacterium]
MKKISVLLIAFLLVASFAFAEETFSVGFSGSASATFGIDLDTQQTGFQNAVSSRVRLTFVPQTDVQSEGSDWYGMIELRFRVQADNGNYGAQAISSVREARITNDVVYIELLTPDIDQQWADDVRDGDEIAGVEFRTLDFASFAGTFASGITGVSPAISGFANDEAGITIGFGDGIVNDLSLGIVSDGDWSDNANYEYGATVNVDLDLAPIRLRNRTFLGQGLFTDTDIAFGNSTLVGVSLEDTGTSVDVGFDVTSNFAEFGDSLEWKASLTIGQELADGTNVHVLAALGEETGVGEDLSLDVGLVFAESTSTGLIPNVGANLALTLMQVLAPEDGMRLGVLFDVEYDEGGLNPFAGVGFHTVLADDDLNFLAFEAGLALGADFHGIDNTTFTLRYGTWDGTTGNSQLGDDFHPGFVTFQAEISF